MFVFPNQTKFKETNKTQPKQTKKQLFCHFDQIVYPNRTKANLTKPNPLNNKFKINCFE